MPEKKKKERPSLSTYRPGVIQGLTEKVIGTPTEYIARLMGLSERDAAQYAGDVVDKIGRTTGFRDVEQSGRNIYGGHAKPTDYLNVGLAAIPVAGRAAPLAGRAARAAEERLLGQRLKNVVVPEPNPAAKTTYTEGRALTNPNQIKYVSRNISTQELDDIFKTGRFNEPPQGSKHTNKPEKWWSAADEEGIFGRHWPKGQHTVRMPVGKLPKGRAASAKHAEIFDPATKSWMPLREYGKKYAIGGVVIDDGNPAKQRKLI